MVAVRPRSRPAAPRTTEPVQTDVVNRVPAWAWRTQSSTRSSCSSGRVPDAAGEDDHVGRGSSSKVASTREPDHAVLAAHLAAVVADEDDVEGRDALQDLVGADGIERGELREERDGDLQAVGHADVLSSGCGTEAPPVGIGRHAEVLLEDAAQGLGAAEAAAGRHHVEGVGRLLELTAGGLQPGAFDEAARGLAHLGGEDPGEVADAHGRRGGEGGQPVVATGRGLDEGLHGPDGRALGAGDPHRRGELGLPAGPVQEHDQPAGHGLGHVDAEVLLDQRQREVDAGGDPGARPVLAVADVDRVGVDGEAGVVLGQLAGAGPVGGDPPSVEEPGRGAEEGARADGGHAPAARGRPADEVEHGLVARGRLGAGPARRAPGCRCAPSAAGRGAVPRTSPLSARTVAPPGEARVTR